MEFLVISRLGLLFAAIMMSVVIRRINSLELTGRLNYSSDGQIGTNATIECSWVKSDSEFQLQLAVVAQSNKKFLVYSPADEVVINDTDFHSRLVVKTTITNLTMTIMNISCLDVDTYICKMVYMANTNKLEKNSTGLLVDIKIRPQVPVMTKPASLVVAEASNITYKCNANLGRPNKGLIVWNAYINGQKVEPSFEPSVKETSNDNNCTVNFESTVTVQANRTKQNITLACFATNQDFMPTAAPTCTSPSTDMCDQSQPLNILYGASKLIVNRSPQSDVEDGSTMTLTCQAEGNPQPTYTWLQVGNENRSLNGVQEGLTNKLILTNISVTDDTGVYNCTATNMVSGASYSITDQVSVSVFPKTTTTTTRKTTLTSSSSSTGSQATGPQTAGGDDDNTNTIIIAVVVPVACILIIVIIVVIVCVKKRKQTKSIIEEPSEKPYNNLSMVNQNFNKSPKPDLVSGDKKFNNDTLDAKYYQSGEHKNDALQYADLNYDNQPRSRKPIALSDASSNSDDYSMDIQMPEV